MSEKLTKAQIRVLRLLNDDLPEDEFDGAPMDRRTGSALERRGLIREAPIDPKDRMQHFMGTIGAVKMELTPAGRAALAAQEKTG